MLHIVNKSHTHTSALQCCLAHAKDGHAVLLIEDGVLAATAAASVASGVAEALSRVKVYALQPDVEARGLAGRLADGITTVDYAGFVGLVTEHTNNQTWL